MKVEKPYDLLMSILSCEEALKDKNSSTFWTSIFMNASNWGIVLNMLVRAATGLAMDL